MTIVTLSSRKFQDIPLEVADIITQFGGLDTALTLRSTCRQYRSIAEFIGFKMCMQSRCSPSQESNLCERTILQPGSTKSKTILRVFSALFPNLVFERSPFLKIVKSLCIEQRKNRQRLLDSAFSSATTLEGLYSQEQIRKMDWAKPYLVNHFPDIVQSSDSFEAAVIKIIGNAAGLDANDLEQIIHYAIQLDCANTIKTCKLHPAFQSMTNDQLNRFEETAARFGSLETIQASFPFKVRSIPYYRKLAKIAHENQHKDAANIFSARAQKTLFLRYLMDCSSLVWPPMILLAGKILPSYEFMIHTFLYLNSYIAIGLPTALISGQYRKPDINLALIVIANCAIILKNFNLHCIIWDNATENHSELFGAESLQDFAPLALQNQKWEILFTVAIIAAMRTIDKINPNFIKCISFVLPVILASNLSLEEKGPFISLFFAIAHVWILKASLFL